MRRSGDQLNALLAGIGAVTFVFTLGAGITVWNLAVLWTLREGFRMVLP